MKVIHLLRKPCSEGTVAANVLRWGTGALNIDATRIRLTGGEVVYTPQGDPSRRSGEVSTNLGFSGNSTDVFRRAQMESTERANTLGRWPANLVLQHLPTCEYVGERRVAGNGARVSSLGKGREGNHTNGIYGAHGSKVTTAYVSEDGTETVAAWACAPGCPVAELDAQSLAGGMHGAGKSCAVMTEGAVNASSFDMGGPRAVYRFGDTGGAPRFFKQVGGKVRVEE